MTFQTSWDILYPSPSRSETDIPDDSECSTSAAWNVCEAGDISVGKADDMVFLFVSWVQWGVMWMSPISIGHSSVGKKRRNQHTKTRRFEVRIETAV